MLAAAASSPARPSSSTLPGHDAPNPSTHGQQLDPGCVDHPVAPPTVTRTRWFKLGARHLAARCPLGWQRSMPELDNPRCSKCRHDAATCPGVRGPPLELQPSRFFFFHFFLLSTSERKKHKKTHDCPSPGSPTPRWSTVPRAIVVTTTDKLPPPKRTHVGAATILWTPELFPPY